MRNPAERGLMRLFRFLLSQFWPFPVFVTLTFVVIHSLDFSTRRESSSNDPNIVLALHVLESSAKKEHSDRTLSSAALKVILIVCNSQVACRTNGISFVR